jgi:mannose-6-phosphate isomerase-like protein (cupin superfamily)
MQKIAIRSPDAAGEYWTEERCFIHELSNDGDDPAVSIARARVAPGVTTRRHCVDGTAERYVIQSGRGEARIGDRPPVAVGPGDVVRIPAGIAQSIRNTGDDDLVFLCICTPRFEWPNYRSLEP